MHSPHLTGQVTGSAAKVHLKLACARCDAFLNHEATKGIDWFGGDDGSKLVRGEMTAGRVRRLKGGVLIAVDPLGGVLAGPQVGVVR